MPSMPTRQALPALALALALTASGIPAFAQTPVTGAWSVTDNRPITVDGAPMALSPDGAWIAGSGPEGSGFCVWDTATLDPTCDDNEEIRGIIPRSVQWSPDSSAIAFSLDAPRYLVDSDVYVFETASGTIENLTEDDPDNTDADDIGFGSDSPGAVPIDLYPSWSPDSQRLVFARTMWDLSSDDDSGTTLMTIPRAGGEPEELLTLAPPSPMIVGGSMAWLDDDTILVPIWKADLSDGQNGIWRVTLTGGIKRVVDGTENGDVPAPTIAGVAADGTGASVTSVLNQYQRGPRDNTFFLLDLEGGEVMAWEDLLGVDAGSGFVYAPPAFSPDGLSVAFVTSTKDGELTVAIADDFGASQPIYTVPDEPGPSFPPSYVEMHIDWATNGTMLVLTHKGAVLLTVERG